MTNPEIAHRRLHNQLITARRFDAPGDVVRWLGAVQAQDYLGSLWAVGLRTPDATEASIEEAIAGRSIVRTWPMRGTIHFVPAEDARWMLKLLAPRVLAAHAGRLLRQLELDEDTFARSREAFIGALQGGKQLPRSTMYRVLEEAGVSAAGLRGLHILWWLAQEGLICFAARQGKQPTFALLDEWVPASRVLEGDEALAELALRYFTSHGPATAQDFAWWSGLTLTGARAGIELVGAHLAQDVIAGQPYWLASSSEHAASRPSSAAWLLPAFDEYTVSYKDRSAVFEPPPERRPQAAFLVLSPIVVVDGQVVGNWKRSINGSSVAVSLEPYTVLSNAQNMAIASAASRYGEFLQMPVAVS